MCSHTSTTREQGENSQLLSLEPHLKSGMPDEVLIPAPEWTTKY